MERKKKNSGFFFSILVLLKSSAKGLMHQYFESTKSSIQL